MEYKDYYKIMGLDRKATPDDIKRAYRKLARKYHPDVSKAADAESQFKELGEAYEVLKDPQKREAYDRLGQDWKQGENFQPPPDWAKGFDFNAGGYTGADTWQFSDFFESLFGHRQGARGAHGEFKVRGEDMQYRLQIRLEDAYHGTESKITLRTPQQDERGQLTTQSRTLNVHIPAGVKRGQRIRLAGQGGQGFGNNAPAGDLYLEIDFLPHALFEDEGRDIVLKLPITPWEAALGAQVNVPTLGGSVTMRIPANSKSNNKLRLKGRGLPGTPPGDQLVVLNLVTPPADTDAARKAYQQLADALPFNPRKHLEAKHEY